MNYSRENIMGTEGGGEGFSQESWAEILHQLSARSAPQSRDEESYLREVLKQELEKNPDLAHFLLENQMANNAAPGNLMEGNVNQFGIGQVSHFNVPVQNPAANFRLPETNSSQVSHRDPRRSKLQNKPGIHADGILSDRIGRELLLDQSRTGAISLPEASISNAKPRIESTPEIGKGPLSGLMSNKGMIAASKDYRMGTKEQVNQYLSTSKWKEGLDTHTEFLSRIGNTRIREDIRDYLLQFPIVMKAAVSLFSLKPFMSPEELKELLESRVGFPLAVPGNAKLSLDHVTKYYSNHFKKNGLLKEEIDALKLLIEAIEVTQAKQSPLDIAMETKDQEIQPDAKSKEIGTRSVPVVCNGNKGIFNLREQNVSCLCPACQSLAKKEGLEHIAISPSCFEQHSGMTTNKKWKYSIRIDGETFKTMGNFLEENNLDHEYKGNCRPSKYDTIVRGMDHERMMGLPVPPGPPQGRGQKDYDESGKQMDADAVEHFSNAPQSGFAFQGASRRKPNASILSEMHSSAMDALPFVQRELQSNTNKFESEEEQHYNEAKGPDTSKDVNSLSLRKRKTPDWTEQSIDSEKRNKKSLTSTFEINVAEGKVPSEGGKDYKSWCQNQEHYTIGSDELAKHLYNEREGGRANIYLKSSMHASTIEENPEIIHWKFLNTNELSLVVKMGDIIFRGALPSLKNSSDSNNEHGRINIEEHLPANELQNENAIHLNSANEADSSGNRNRQNSTSNFGGRVREHISNIKKRKEMKIPVHAMPVREDAKIKKQGHKAGGTDASANRRDRALEEYQNLIESGPPPGAKCCLCHLTENETIPNSAKGLLGRAYVGLGRLQLVRTSAIQNSWVHEQCIRWSPDVYDPVGDGFLNNVKDEIRRGRMLRCRVCNEKGATLGCMKKTCKYSYHLHCARDYDCLLNIDPYAVACPEHVDQLPDGLGGRIGIKHKAKKRGSENPSANNKSADRHEDRAHPNDENGKNREERRKNISPLQNDSRIRSKENSASKNRSGVEILMEEDKTNRRFSLRSSARKGDDSGIEEIHITDKQTL